MQIELIFDEFTAPFSDLIDKERFEVLKSEKEGTWIVKRIKKDVKEKT